jgi:hypothetical protein
MGLKFSSQIEVIKVLVIIVVLLMIQCVGRADIPPGNWAFSGNILDYGMASRGPIFTNTFTITGHCSNGHFILDTTPIKTMDDVAESAGWDGNLLCLIQRGSPIPHNNGAPRTNCIGYVEPNVFSYYATYGLSAVLTSFADSNQLADLEQKKMPVILGRLRIYPEENNTYKVTHSDLNSTEIEAICPGLRPGRIGLEPIPGFEQGFTRWKFKSSLVPTNGTWILSAQYDEPLAKLIKPTTKQLQDRAVTVEIFFQPETQAVTSFRPPITEQRLGVMDYSARKDFFPWTKGQFDWHCDYYLTNQQWDFPTAYIKAEEADMQKHFVYWNGLPQDMLDWVNTGKSTHALPPFGERRILIISGFVGFSIISAALFWFVTRRYKPTNNKSNQ